MNKRILLKLSGEALGNDESNLDVSKLDKLASQLKEVVNEGYQIGIVVGGGNLVRGKDLAALGMDRSASDHIGMMATVMNAQALKYALIKNDLKAEVYSALEVSRIHSFEKSIVNQKLDEGYIVIFAGGTSNPYFTTDSAAALRALEINASTIYMAKNGVDGVYDSDPKQNPQAQRYAKMSFNDILKNELKVIDATAAALCHDNGLKAFVFDMNEEGNLIKAVKGEAVGTYID